MSKPVFDTNEIHVLEDDRARLRPLFLDDFDNIVHFSVEEPEIWTYSLSTVNDPATLKNYLAAAVAGRNSGSQYPFLVFDKKEGKPAGSTRFYDIDLAHGTASIGYTWYGKNFQGTGLNRHCKFLMLQFAFEKLGLARVEFRADHNNARSIAAMKSIGCTVEGVLRENLLLPDGNRRSSIVLSILHDEWFGSVREKLMQKL